MFSLFHKDSARLGEQKAGDEARTGPQQPGRASNAGVTQGPLSTVRPPEAEAAGGGVPPQAMPPRNAMSETEAADVESVDRHAPTSEVGGRNAENSAPAPACAAAPSPGPSVSWTGEEAEEFPEEDDERAANTEPVEEERGTPVRLTGRR